MAPLAPVATTAALSAAVLDDTTRLRTDGVGTPCSCATRGEVKQQTSGGRPRNQDKEVITPEMGDRAVSLDAHCDRRGCQKPSVYKVSRRWS